MPLDVVLACHVTSDTGKLLARDLGYTFYNDHVPRDQVRYLIRWGNGSPVPRRPQLVINKMDAICATVDKNNASRIFAEKGISTPPRTDDVPCVGRASWHTQGQGFWLCWEASQVVSAQEEGANYFIKYIPIKQEYRIHVLGDEAAFVQRKYSQVRVSTAFMGIQGFRDDWHKQVLPISEAPRSAITQAIRAVKVLGLDFGGVDVVMSIANNMPYVLEVNSGPALPTEETRAPYVAYIHGRTSNHVMQSET